MKSMNERRSKKMGANSTQGAAITAFLAGWCIVAISVFFGGILTVAVGLGVIGFSVALFRKCKPWENAENGGSK
jgi:hypothetical protein